MKKKIGSIVAGRLARNIYAWCAVLYLRYSYDDFHLTAPEYGFNLLLAATLAAALYINNLVLVPRLLARKKQVWYFIALIALGYAYASASASVIYYAKNYLPLAKIVNIIWVPINPASPVSNYKVLQFMHGVIFALLIFIFTLCWYLIDYRKKQKELTEAQKKQTEAELAFLKTQLNPHFLFNTLNNLYGLALKKSDDAPECILKLSVIMRYILYESDRPLVSFAKEKAIMEAYIELELLRLSDTGQMNFVINADKEYQLPPLLWMPILENLFKHGTRHITDQLQLSFSCTIVNSTLTIASKNPCNTHAVRDTAGGIGLQNLEKRLALLYPGSYTLDATTDKDIYYINLQIKLT